MRMSIATIIVESGEGDMHDIRCLCIEQRASLVRRLVFMHRSEETLRFRTKYCNPLQRGFVDNGRRRLTTAGKPGLQG